MKRGKLAAAVAIALVGCACMLLIAGCGNKALDNIDQKVRDAAQAEFGAGSGFVGYASNDYVNPSDYSVTSAKVQDVKADGSTVSGTVVLTLENDSFKSEGTYAFTASADDDGKLGAATFDLQSQETTAKKGIDFDNEHSVAKADADFDSAAQSCVVKSVKPGTGTSTWYVTTGTSQTLSYAFDGTSWSFAGDNLGDRSTAFSPDIEGTYSSDTGKDYHGGTFTLSELDASTGTCKVEWTIKYDSPKDYDKNLKESDVRGSASGSEEVSITQVDGKWGFDLSSKGSTEGGSNANVNLRITFDDSVPGQLNIGRIYSSATPSEQSQWEFRVVYSSGGSGRSLLAADKHEYVPSKVTKQA